MRGPIVLFGALSALLCGLLIGANRMPAGQGQGHGGGARPGLRPALAATARKRPTPLTGPRPPRGRWLALVYGGNGQGEIEPCG